MFDMSQSEDRHQPPLYLSSSPEAIPPHELNLFICDNLLLSECHFGPVVVIPGVNPYLYLNCSKSIIIYAVNSVCYIIVL